MPKPPLPLNFLGLLFISLSLAFGIHLGLLSHRELPLFDHLILRSYVVNGLLAAGIFLLLYKFRRAWKDRIGFLFMGGSLLKFLVFFLFFYPVYTSDEEMSSLEFASFFVPYGIALGLETYFVTQLLKTLEDSDKKATL